MTALVCTLAPSRCITVLARDSESDLAVPEARSLRSGTSESGGAMCLQHHNG
jgi:hypothetical protein